jgi:hypothetical protein
MAVDTEEVEVIGPAGGRFTVLTEGERDLFDDLVARYLSDNSFQNVSDLQDLERVIHFEVMSLRYVNWLSTGSDYFGEPTIEKEVSDILKTLSGELRQLKKAMGVDRVSRQKDSSESLAEYIENLKQRSKTFGIMREDQLTKALTLFNELKALITLHNNTTDEERRKQRVRLEDIKTWLEETAFPEYDAIDQHFVDNEQRYWVQQQ